MGRRVVLRQLVGSSADGRPILSDALGDLIFLSADEAVVDTRRGLARVPRAGIASARLVQPSIAEQLALEATAARGWVARTTETSADGWLLRADAGWTGRANSALVLRSLSRPLDEALQDIGRWYAARGLKPRLAVPLPAMSATHHALIARGWGDPDDSHVLVARLDLLARTLAGRPASARTRVELATAPEQTWLDAYHYRGGALPANAAELLVRHERAVFVSVLAADGTVAGIARGVIDDGWLGVTAVEVAPQQRRQGVGRQILAAVAGWAADRGAQRCYLQVSADNHPALGLYRGLGFHRHHSYSYLNPPTISPDTPT